MVEDDIIYQKLEIIIKGNTTVIVIFIQLLFDVNVGQANRVILYLADLSL